MANEWNKTAFVEFETMLRRHLRIGAAPVAACAGFDLDAASAYLEGALDEWRRASYESHLAGCAICRRHLIELARLAQSAPSFEARPAAAPDRIPAWDRWKETLAGWFDLSSWNLKWQIAGASVAAFAILIAALGAQPWLYTSDQAELASSNTSATSAPAPELAAQPLPSPTPEPSPQEVATSDAPDLALKRPAQPGVPPPELPVAPIGNADAKDFTFEAKGGALTMYSIQSPEAPVPANGNRPTAAELNPERLSGRLEELAAVANTARRSGEAKQSPPPRSRALVQINDLNRSESGWDEFREAPGARAAQETADSPDVIPRYRPDLVKNKSELRANPQPDRPRPPRMGILPEIKLWSLPELWKRSLSAFGKSDSNTESARKTRADKQEASDDGAPKPMQVMIRDKIFCFEKCKGPDLEKIRGMWIDREYDFEKQKWNVWTLRRGSEEYKRALAEEPLLKEFFDHGPILVVWKNRIYKVLK